MSIVRYDFDSLADFTNGFSLANTNPTTTSISSGLLVYTEGKLDAQNAIQMKSAIKAKKIEVSFNSTAYSGDSSPMFTIYTKADLSEYIQLFYRPNWYGSAEGDCAYMICDYRCNGVTTRYTTSLPRLQTSTNTIITFEISRSTSTLKITVNSTNSWTLTNAGFGFASMYNIYWMPFRSWYNNSQTLKVDYFLYEIDDDIKFLVQDGDSIKNWDATNLTYVTIGTTPVTEEMFTTYGMQDMPISKTGLVSSDPQILFYTVKEGDYTVTQYLIPAPTVIISNDSTFISRAIASFEAGINITGDPAVKIILSIDEGVTWQAYYNSAWATVDPTNYTDVATKGMSVSAFGILTAAQIALLGSITSIRYGVYVDVAKTTNKVELSYIKAIYQ